MIKSEEVFCIGRIVKYRGISGEVELQFTDDAFDRGSAEYLVMDIDGILVPFFWEEYRFKNDHTAIFKFENVDNEQEAKRLVGLKTFYPFAHLDPESEDELSSIRAVTGFRVFVEGHGELGVVEAVDDSSANVLFTVVSASGEEYILPYHDDFLVDFDMKQRSLTLDLPEGLLDIN